MPHLVSCLMAKGFFTMQDCQILYYPKNVKTSNET